MSFTQKWIGTDGVGIYSFKNSGTGTSFFAQIRSSLSRLSSPRVNPATTAPSGIHGMGMGFHFPIPRGAKGLSKRLPSPSPSEIQSAPRSTAFQLGSKPHTHSACHLSDGVGMGKQAYIARITLDPSRASSNTSGQERERVCGSTPETLFLASGLLTQPRPQGSPRGVGSGSGSGSVLSSGELFGSGLAIGLFPLYLITKLVRPLLPPSQCFQF